MKQINTIIVIATCSLLAGITIFIGGIVARIFEKYFEKTIEAHIINWTVAFGGGILVAAVAFVLVPRGVAIFSIPCFTLIFLSGALIFFLLDKKIEKSGGALAQTMAMLMDFIPEAISLGAVFGHDRQLGLLLAAFIGAQNLPEGFNAFREITESGMKARTALATLLGSSLFGPIAACVGYFFLQEREKLTAGIMIFAAGGILYLIFQDIAPQSKMRRHWLPPIGAVIGFAVGMLGKLFEPFNV